MASFVIVFPLRVFDEEFYLLNNDSKNSLPFKLSMRLGVVVGRWAFKCLAVVFMVFCWKGLRNS